MLRLELLDTSAVIEYQHQVVSTIPALKDALREGPFRDWWRRLLDDLAAKVESTPFTTLRSSDAEMRGTLRELFAPELATSLNGMVRDRFRSRREQALLKAIRSSCSLLSTFPVQVRAGTTLVRLVIERPGRTRGRSFEGTYAVRVVCWSARDIGGYFRWQFRTLLGLVYEHEGVSSLLPPQRFGVLTERAVAWAHQWRELVPVAYFLEPMGIGAVQLLHVRATLQALLKAGSIRANIPLLLTLFAFRLRDPDGPKGMLVYDELLTGLDAPDGIEPAPFHDFCQELRRACHLTLADKLLAINCYGRLTVAERSEFMAIAQADDRNNDPIRAFLPPGDVTALLAASVVDVEAFLDEVDSLLTANIKRGGGDESAFLPLLFNELE
jgi:hypothetical protein